MEMDGPAMIPIIVVVVATLIAAFLDVRTFKVPNAITFPLMIGGLVYHGSTAGMSGLLASLLGILFGGGVLITMHAMGGMGAGDVKIMAGVGAWLGMPSTIYVFVASALAAGIYSLGLILWRGKLSETWANLLIILYRFSAIGAHLGPEDSIEEGMKLTDRRRRFIPFAAMVAVGVIATLVVRHWFPWGSSS